MYESFYGLKEKPFRIVPNPGYLFPSSRHQQALTYLEYGLMEDAGFILLTGEIGTGKTTLIRHILNGLEKDILVAVVFNTNVSADELLRFVLQSFDLPLPEGGKAPVFENLYRFLIDRYAERKRVLLIVDEAQSLSDEAMEEVRMLSNLQSDDQVLLQIMLVGQPELRVRLQGPRLSSLTQRIGVNFHLGPLDPKESVAYIAHRLKKAGGKLRIFEPEALKMICRVSHGVPRTINLLCDAAMVYGFGYEMNRIGLPVIKQVLRDRGDLGVKPEPVPKCTSGNHQAPMVAKMIKRVQTLEIQVKDLKQQIESFKNNGSNSFKKLFEDEQKRYKRLLMKYSMLVMQCKKDQNPKP